MNLRTWRLAVVALGFLWGCSGGEAVVKGDSEAADVPLDTVAEGGRSGDAVELVPDLGLELPEWDVPDVPEPDGFQECQPGDGCFLDPCTENSQCQSGWCVEHLGAGVCTTSCQEECPPGWSCQQVAGTEPDVVYVCVSAFANLCKPCVTGADCTSIAGKTDLCVDYGPDGNFCGGPCDLEEDKCPSGFACAPVTTTDGLEATQCLPENEQCECTDMSVAQLLFTECEVSNEFGTCTGKRVCTEEGLSDCDAAEPLAETCNGVDDDCDGDVDEPDNVGGDLVNLCDDGNPCTADTCDGEEGCLHEPQDGTECTDGNPCTVADHCVAGSCEGTPAICDDNNPCTDDSCGEDGGCLFTNNNKNCDDGDPCTVADECNGGQCTGVAVACDCQADEDCAALEDGDVCNGTLYCNADKLPYQCAIDPETVVLCPEPEGLNAPCLASACDPATGACSFHPAHEGMACDDGDACTIGDHCEIGVCTGGVGLNCNDGNLCTDDSCDPEAGCVHTPNSDPCNDGDFCTVGDLCAEGECVGGAAKNCDDLNACTDDGCDPASGCVHTANEADCDDNNACTTGDHCLAGACVGTGSLECDDGNPCTKDLCLPAGGCVYENVAGACSDGDPCTVNDFCQDGACVPGAQVLCDDGNVCTDDACVDGLCEHTANAAPCDDGNLCTTGESCAQGVCGGGQAVVCDDDNLCTTDLCNPLEGCFTVANSVACDDGNACTVGDTCGGGECLSGAALECDDDNPCTTDGCDPESGCLFEDNTLPCDDGDACTVGDTCGAGSCQAGAQSLVCDDDNLCTTDSCDPQSGCLFENNALACDDGNACTLADKCANGVCQAGTQSLNCDDGIICTVDHCLPLQGCLHTLIVPCCGNGLVEPAEQCDDGNNVGGDGCSATCQLPACDDGFLNGTETDLDCGGTCPPCPDGSDCLVEGDCVSQVCLDGLCQEPTCVDGVQNGSETDVDCGADCPACGDGQGCLEDGDCLSQYCLNGVCQEPACDDGIFNGIETDVDCGGDCPPCADNQGCLLDADCTSGVCLNGICQEPTCVDGVTNGLETDVDCGNGCPACGEGQGCELDGDCLTGALCLDDGTCSSYGSGALGELNVGGGTTVLNSARAQVLGQAGQTTLAAGSSLAGFAPGQWVIIHQSRGGETGYWEEKRVVSIDQTNLTVSSPLAHSYGTMGLAQAIVVPEYTAVNLSGGTLTAAAWNGQTGGILAFVATESVTLAGGSMSMDSNGYRGQSHGCTFRCSHGHSGESPSGDKGTGTAPARNGMGGGGGTQGQDCAAGGGGGYGTAGGAGHNGTGQACAASPHVGGQGGLAGGEPDTGTLVLFGGAGGEGGGDEDGSYPGKGGDGGGIIIVKSPAITIGSSTTSRGQNGANGVQNQCGTGCGMAGGGGGAGGGIYLFGETVALGTNQVVATGGTGGHCTCSNGYPAGNGGVGRVGVRADSVSGTTNPAFVALEPWQ